ncbi:MAG: NAD(P)/FAD-dependent oxidoreductase [Actinomycetales bacterium]
MKEVLVLGGGFAGVWAAAGAVRTRKILGAPDDAFRVTLVAPADDMVIRPRLYESDPARMRVSLDRVLGPIGVRRVAATALGIDTAAGTVDVVERDGAARTLHYDRLALATGSRLIRPTLPGAEHLFDVDTLPAAAALHSHLQRLADDPDKPGAWTAVVVGAGFTGIEVATELTGRLAELSAGHPVRVLLVDLAAEVGPELGDGPRPEILKALAETGVEVVLNTTIDRVEPTRTIFSDGTEVDAATVIWTAGMRANHLTEQIPAERDRLGRLVVDEFLRVPQVPGVYAAGDTAAAVAEPGHTVTQSCQHAVPQGKFVGVNVASDLLGHPLVPFAPDPYVTCLDLGEAGAVLTLGWDRTVSQTGDEAKKLKSSINSEWIYPTVDDPDLILLHADHRTTWPTASL